MRISDWSSDVCSSDLLWLLPLFYAIWTAFHPAAFSAHFDPLAPLTLENFATAWESAPFPRYVLNTVILVTVILAGQFLLCTLAAYAFARFSFRGSNIAFALVLVQQIGREHVEIQSL